MIAIQLPDGSKREFPQAVTVAEVAASIGAGLAKAALAGWTPTTKRYSINGREMEFNAPADIVRVVRYWQAEVQREERTAQLLAGKADRRKTYVRIGRA